MRFLSLIFVLAAFSLITNAQVNIPLFSEPSILLQRVGNTNFRISYERPKANGRKIFGDSEPVPYGKVWRTGAGPCTKISFDKSVFINDIEISEGTYSLFTIPNKNKWTIILNSDTTLYGAYDYDSTKDLVRMQANIESKQIWTETFNINLDVKNDVALIRLSWKDIVISFPIETRTYEELIHKAHDILENNYDLEEGKYTVLAEYIIHNKIGFGADYLSIASKLVDKALEVEEENHYNYFSKRSILKLQNDRQEYMKYSKMQIQYLEKAKPYNGYEEDIMRIKAEMKKWEP